MTTIFLSNLNVTLAGATVYDSEGNAENPDATPLMLCTIIFMFVGLTMFLLPPVPGVPVYISGGVILCPAAMRAWGGESYFLMSILFCTGVCFVVKCMAIFGQQKGFGGLMSGYVSVRKAVGVNDLTIRAVREILIQPGLTPGKVCVLCGGPDWPTSVLTGILGLSFPKMLFGSIPVAFLILPCVAAGALLAHPKNTPDSEGPWKTISGVTLAISAMMQTLAMIAAMYFIEGVSAKKRDYLLGLPKDKEVEALEIADARKKKAYNQATDWHTKMTIFPRFLLGGAAFMLTMTCYGLQFQGSKCFYPFAVTDTISGLLVPPDNICRPSICEEAEANAALNGVTFTPSEGACKQPPIPQQTPVTDGEMLPLMTASDAAKHCEFDATTSKCKFLASGGCCTLLMKKVKAEPARCKPLTQATESQVTACNAVTSPTATNCLTANNCQFIEAIAAGEVLSPPLQCKGKLLNLIKPMGWMAIGGFFTGLFLFKAFNFWAQSKMKNMVIPEGDLEIAEENVAVLPAEGGVSDLAKDTFDSAPAGGAPFTDDGETKGEDDDGNPLGDNDDYLI
jgi:hypothetical protein